MTPRGARYLLILPTAIVLALFIAVPMILPYGEVVGLTGVPVIMDNMYVWSELDPVSALTYGFGDILCHQESDRSFLINGSQMPVCVRDTFIISGFLLGLLSFLIFRHELSVRSVAIVTVVATALLFLDHTVQMVFGLNVPSTRAITGLVFGFAVSMIVECWFQYYERQSNAHLY